MTGFRASAELSQTGKLSQKWLEYRLGSYVVFDVNVTLRVQGPK